MASLLHSHAAKVQHDIPQQQVTAVYGMSVGLPGATAVDGTLCERLSQGYDAIQSIPADR